MQPINQIVGQALTATKAPLTPELRHNTESWQRWASYRCLGDPQLESMLRAVAEFVLDVKEGKRPRWLSLLGTTNAGKTYLAKRVWNWYLRQPFRFAPQAEPLGFSDDGQWCYWPDVADALRANSGYGQLEQLQYERFLVLDDIAAERDVSGHVAEKICTLLDRRIGKWTVITSNKSLEQIAELDRRIAGRIIREPNKFVQVNVPDYFTR